MPHKDRIFLILAIATHYKFNCFNSAQKLLNGSYFQQIFRPLNLHATPNSFDLKNIFRIHFICSINLLNYREDWILPITIPSQQNHHFIYKRWYKRVTEFIFVRENVF